MLALALAAGAGAARLELRPSVHRLLEREVAGKRFHLDCSYAARGGEAIAFPAWRGLRPEVYVRPGICLDANTAATAPPERVGAALLVLAHEAMHIAGVTDETAAECAALALVPGLARSLRVPEGRLPGIVDGAAAKHAALLARFPRYGACPAG